MAAPTIDDVLSDRDAIEAQLRSLVDQAPDGIFVADIDGRYTEVNAAGCRMLGLSRDEIVGRTIVDLIPEQDVPRLAAVRERLLAGDVDVGEWRLRRSDGSYLPVEVSAKILPDGRWQGFVRDISERKQLSATIDRTLDELKRAQSVAKIGSWRLDVVRNELTWSEESYRIFGVPVGTPLTYETFLARAHPDDRDYVDRRWKAALAGEPYDLEHRIVVDGEVRWVRERADLAFDADGTLRGGVGITQDITERKAAEAALRDRELRYRSLFDRSLDALLLTAPDGRIVMANIAATELFGYTERELQELGRAAIVDTDDPRVAAALEERRRTGRFRGELTMRTKAGGQFAAEISSGIFRDERGDEWTSMLIRDVRERKAQEAERERLAAEVDERRRWLEAVLAQVPVAVLIVDADGHLHPNARAEELLGVELAPAGGTAQYAGLVRFPDGTPVPASDLVMARAMRGHVVIGEEQLVERADGTRIPVLGNAAPIRDDDGRAVGAIGVFQDVSEQMRAAEAVAARERLLSGIFEILPVGLFIADRSGRFVRTNPAAVKIWGGRRAGAAELAEYEAFSLEGERVAPEEWPLARALSGEEALDKIIRIKTFDGLDKTIVASALPLRDAAGAAAGAIVVNTDITDLKRTEDALRRAVQEREEVLAIVAHDLRSPLSSAYLAVGMLLETLENEPDRALVESIRRSLRSTNRLIEDLLDIATIEAGRLSIERAPVATGELMREAVDSLRPLAAGAGLELVFDPRVDPPPVLADRGRLLQILSNLIGNAIKFTPSAGRVRVDAQPHGDDVRFSVSDTGPGISPRDAAHLFEPFWQARRADRRGAGLGLAIAKDLVQLHGGCIWFDSAPGRGSTFYFTIPIAPATAAPEAREAPERHREAPMR